MKELHDVAKVAQYGGASTAFFCGLSASEVAALGGLVVGIAGLLINAIFLYRRDQREQARMDRIGKD
jgi:hypothetical protein